MSQSELAQLVGFSVRAIQSCEQGWRKPSATLEKAVLLVLMAHRNGGTMRDVRCWEYMQCSMERCERCITYLSGQGHLCWFLSGTLCKDSDAHEWEEKRVDCVHCRLFKFLLGEAETPAAT